MTLKTTALVLFAACALLSAALPTSAAQLKHKYSRAEVEAFVDSLQVSKENCSLNAQNDFNFMTEDWLLEDYFEKDAKAIWDKWAAFRARCKAKFGRSSTGRNPAYQYRFYKPKY